MVVKTALSLLTNSAYASVFAFLSRYVRPELMLAGLYTCLWIDPWWFGEKTFTGLSWGLWLEFIMAHAHTAMAVVSMAVTVSKPSGKIAVGVMSLFYLLFVGAVSFATGSLLTVIMFIVLSTKRITMPAINVDFVKEGLYAFFKVMIFLLTAGLGAGIAVALPADVLGMEGVGEGAENVPAWGVCYFTALYFYEDKIAKKYFGPTNEKKTMAL
jgi:hypothetical protein